MLPLYDHHVTSHWDTCSPVSRTAAPVLLAVVAQGPRVSSSTQQTPTLLGPPQQPERVRSKYIAQSRTETYYSQRRYLASPTRSR